MIFPVLRRNVQKNDQFIQHVVLPKLHSATSKGKAEVWSQKKIGIAL